jgi:peptidoglycan hydrolase-like protein with peptidoglycan-binding domain
MKKTISILLLSGFVLILVGLGYIANAQVAIGSRSEEVKRIQEILKTDPAIYPEGLITGYFGPLTEKAVKKLQKKCGIPETGVIDDATEKCIYPINYKIRVISPNGGEVWNRNETHTIRWEVTEPEVSIPERPFWPKASIDLFRRITTPCPTCPAGAVCAPCIESTTSVFVKHIATVNLFDMSWTYNPRAISDVPNGSDYVVRISVGKGVAPIWEQETKTAPDAAVSVKPTEIWPIITPPDRWISWDESDGTFEITGEITPCPICPVCPNSEEIIASLTRVIEELQKLITSLRTSR